MVRAAPAAWTRVNLPGDNPGVTTPGVTSDHDPGPERLFGAYLFALCIYQIGIYCWPGGPPFILDPRAGIPVLLINHFSFDNKVIYPVEWITAAWLVVAAAMNFFRGKFLIPYAAAEVVLAAPSAYYIGVLAVRHGGDFAPGFKDLVLTVLLFLVFSLLPFAWAVTRILSRKRAGV
jgi:hypothetical protein